MDHARTGSTTREGRSIFGVALRAWRDRTDPATLGVDRHAARRVTGLRRGELATLAGISAEYVAQLEQGRGATPSAQVCLALARALQLSDTEQAHLLRLAGHVVGPDRVPRLIPASVRRVVDQLDAHPLSVHDATWQLLHWNPLFTAVWGDPSEAPAADRNAMIIQFEGLNPRVRQSAAERDWFERSLVADLRTTAGRYPGDPDVAALIERLDRTARFRELWARPVVAAHESAHKVAVHPEVGEIALDANILPIQDSDLRIVVLTARPGTDARGALDRLLSPPRRPC
ncbi:helix-turn-helix domain-containing protein [Cryptosporangium arvum]|uniref:Putative transcriptional regulator n=1 Tax=Cryptosporangium arvum DSM 44712 TaxID=927661 RepID=A0A010Z5J4_9ACTN|nr:helix-turn-helix transcriptional regulator [Cryptosporangium arvum]EXG82618.1 putative transcriptional regulator [Cryptosporangium arvum DSM 44712]